MYVRSWLNLRKAKETEQREPTLDVGKLTDQHKIDTDRQEDTQNEKETKTRMYMYLHGYMTPSDLRKENKKLPAAKSERLMSSSYSRWT